MTDGRIFKLQLKDILTQDTYDVTELALILGLLAIVENGGNIGALRLDCVALLSTKLP